MLVQGPYMYVHIISDIFFVLKIDEVAGERI